MGTARNGVMMSDEGRMTVSRPIILYAIPTNSIVVIHGFDTSITRNRRAKDLPSCYPSKPFFVWRTGSPDEIGFVCSKKNKTGYFNDKTFRNT
jgi:hypothetical protein